MLGHGQAPAAAQAAGAGGPPAHQEPGATTPSCARRSRPDYDIGCKRILPSNKWYPALSADNVELVTSGVAEVKPNSIVDEDGVEREVDVILLGTGFHVADMPVGKMVTGRSGQTLDETWHGSPRALLGSTMPDFPNLFMLLGPNTGLGHNSMVYMIESQIAYVMDALRAMREHGAATVEVRPEAAEAFNEEVDRRHEGTVWSSGCASLVPRRHRPQRDAVARLDVPVPAPDLVVQPGALPAGVMKRVLLTGAASGIGEATAAELRRQGVQVAGLDLAGGRGHHRLRRDRPGVGGPRGGRGHRAPRRAGRGGQLRRHRHPAERGPASRRGRRRR